jgi:membrane-anchored protein YejM (alkaline phosphatase superfamily)
MPILIGSRRTVQILLAINSTLLSILMFLDGGARLVAGMLILNGFVCNLYFSNNVNATSMDFFVDG